MRDEVLTVLIIIPLCLSLPFYSFVYPSLITSITLHIPPTSQLSAYFLMSKKVVLKLHIHDSKEKQKALKAVSSLSGLESLAMDMKEKKLTVVGDVDPIKVVSKLRKSWETEILTVGPAKEPEKKKEDEQKKNKDDDNKKKEEEKKKKENEQMAELLKFYRNYNPYNIQPYQVYSAEENPNSCVIS